MLRVDPKKRMVFNPEESIDFNGHTGSFIQYTYARIQSILRKFEADGGEVSFELPVALHEKERELIKTNLEYPAVVQQAADEYNPALVANYAYELVKHYNQFYQNCHILGAEDAQLKAFRVGLSGLTARVVEQAMGLLGIDMPERM